MSAIFGILRFDGGAVSAHDLERMGNVLAHRGPDGRKFTVDGAVGLGHCLMRVNREDAFEAQPLRDQEADLTLVADCRIDNREELAETFGLSTANIRDLPDSAFILRAYKKWGEDCAAHLLGDFAFAVWDGQTKKLLLARDHMGQRSVFYHKGQNFIAFATEIKGLWALAEVPRQLLDDMLFRDWARYKWPERMTLYAGISALPGGTVAIALQDGTFKSHDYWEPHPDPAHENRDEIYYVEQYRQVLTEAVACRLRRLTGPAALLNSAGFDTAAIAGLAGPTLVAQERKLISLSWLGSKATETAYGDIRPWVEACRRVMPHLDIRYLSREGENPLIDVERRFSINDGPASNAHKISFYLHAEAAAAGARLIMDGLGGDYTINPRGFFALAGHLRRGEFRRFFAELRPHLRATGQSPWQILKSELIMAALPRSVVDWLRHVRGRDLSAQLQSALRETQGPRLQELMKRITADNKFRIVPIPFAAQREQIWHFARRTSRGFVAGGAIAAAAHGLDQTRPFHDKRVVEFGLAIPEDLYVKHGINRYLARRALADVYPPEFQTRGRKNVGVLTDDTAILNAAIPELIAEAALLAKNTKLAAYFDLASVRRILQAAPSKSKLSLLLKSLALNTLLKARFIEWFDRSNAS